MTTASERRMAKLRLADLTDDDLRGKRVFVRVDFNVPLNEGGSVEADARIRRSLPTLRRLREAGARTVLLSHLGRPGGRADPALSLKRVGERVSELLGSEVRFVEGVVGPQVAEAVEALEPGGSILLENTRFHPGEKENDPELCRAWADLADLYVNDAFGSAHRAHASTVGLAEAVREAGGLAVAGTLMDEEIRFLHEALENPDRPFVAILGGAKISGKIDAVESFLPRVDRLLVGGAMANTFFRALGLETGSSLVEEDRVEMARDVLERGGEKIVLPVDCVVADAIESGVETRVVERTDIGPGESVGDIGPATRSLFGDVIEEARTVVWNGPMGVIEIDEFAGGTMEVARHVAETSDAGTLTIVGGGDSAAAVDESGMADRINHISTGGGAALELLSGVVLPGIEALSDAEAP
ncbi:MAG: phosphoglycerate kinase [Longimicrobiales bacterium]|nr:phosphoglycerate kinase [Longimicrobiales bacterium]